MRLSDDELNELRFDPESDRVERKRTASDRSAIRRNICAFSNDLPGHGRAGVILVGVEDDGSCASLPVDDRLLRNLAQMRDDGNIIPLPSLSVELRVLDGCRIAVVTVEPSTAPPVRYQGRVWVKVGPTVRLATPEEEGRLAERRRAANLPFDMRPVEEATLDDLDLDYFRTQYLPRAVAPDVLEQNRRPLVQQLRALRLAVGERPTRGALLALGREPRHWLPGAYVQFLRLGGSSLTDPVLDRKELAGRLDDVLREMDTLLKINLRARIDVVSGAREIAHVDYPLVALRQLAFNAVMHRSYEETNAPVRLYWYTDRVEIRNPGGLYGKVDETNFGTGATDYRNPLIAEVMHHLGFAQRFGLGIPLAREALQKNGNPPPEFHFQPAHVIVVVRPAP